jgi:hypothetical protein
MKKWCVFLLAGAAYAQQLDLSSLDKLAGRAKESSSVTLDAAKLKLVSGFLSSEDASQEKAKGLISGLRGIFVRTFEFDGKGEYSQADLEPLRKQLAAPGWANIVNVKERTESTEVWLFSKNDVLDGIAIIAAEPGEVAVVNIVGPIDINALSKLSGSFGIPNIGGDLVRKAAPKPSTPKAQSQPQPQPQKRDDDDEDENN